jgi:hypothetical protein
MPKRERMYASLTGPLLGLYFPLPGQSETENRVMLNKSKLSKLWCSIYPESMVDKLIISSHGTKLDESYALNLM